MQFKPLALLAILGSFATAAPAPSSGFPKDIQPGILNVQNYINGVINDLVQGSSSLGLDYSSTGRSLAFLERSILPNGCATNLPAQPKTQNGAIAALQNVQLTLSNLALDAINGDLNKGKKDVCLAVNGYGSVAAYVQKVTTGKL